MIPVWMLFCPSALRSGSRNDRTWVRKPSYLSLHCCARLCSGIITGACGVAGYMYWGAPTSPDWAIAQCGR